MKYKIMSLLLVAILSFNIAGCANKEKEVTVDPSPKHPTEQEKDEQTSSKDETKISFMLSQGSWRDAYQEMADKIKEDENINVEFQVIPDDQYYALVKTKLSVGEVPDIIQYNTPTNNVELNCQENIEDLSSEEWVSRLSNPNILKDAQDGKIYAMPLESSSFFGPVYYNKAILKDMGISEEQPKTYEEFLNVLRAIKEKSKDIVPVYMCEKDSWTTQVFTTLGFGVATADKTDVWKKLMKNEVDWSDVPEFKMILEEFMVLFNEKLVNENHLSATYDMAKEALGTGKAAMILNGEWAVSDIASKWPDTEIGAWILPFADEDIMGTGAFVQGYFVTKNGHPEEAKKFLNIWSQPQYQNMYWAATPGFPGFKDVDGGEVVPCVQELVDKYIVTGKYAYQMNDQISIVSPILPELWKYYVEMTMGTMSPEEVLEAWDKKYKDFMKSKEMPGF